ncbi:MAG: pentapeptide repeat-containing protein, partial [Pseudomonadota bacterium]
MRPRRRNPTDGLIGNLQRVWRKLGPFTRLAAVACWVGVPWPAAADSRADLICPETAERQGTHNECPCKVGWKPTDEQLAGILRSHELWLEQGGLRDASIPGQALLCNGDLVAAELSGTELSGARLDGARLSYARLERANLNGANLAGADLRSAQLKHARLSLANLENADLGGADLEGALLESTIVTDAHLAFASLKGARYAPASLPPDSHVERIEGLASVVLSPGKQSGLVQLRELFRQAGLRDLEREATFAIEHNMAEHARRLGGLPDQLVGWLKLVFFE